MNTKAVGSQWRGRLGLVLMALLVLPGWAQAACAPMSVPDAFTTPSTSPMASSSSISISVGTRCDGFGLNPYPGTGTTNPAHGTVTVDTIAGTVTYTNNGDGATGDSFVVVDGSGNPFTVNVAISATVSPIIVSPVSLSSPQVGTAYSQTLSATGGTAPYSYAVTSGSLPPGLSLSGATISGTPNQAGGYTATITVTDNVGTTGTKSYTTNVPIPTIAIASPPNANLNTAYSYALSANATGALAPYTYSLLSGSLPPGLSLSGGVISGTPTAVGTSSFVLHAVDSSPNIPGVSPGPYASNVSLSITVQNVPPTAGSVGAGVTYNSTNNPVTLNITGAPATSVAVGTPATHGTATASGTSITYTPTAGYAGPDSFTYTATNGAGTSVPATVSVTVSPPTVTFTPTAPPNPTAGTTYSHSIANASGGATPYTYTLSTGVLPSGLTLASNGTIGGTSTAVGTFAFKVVATDSSTGTGPFTSAPANVTLVVDAPIITLAPSTLSGGTANTAYTQTITATSGTAPYTYAVTTGTLPTGITLSSGGVLSGTPTQAGSFPITVTATDSSTGSGAPYSGSRAYTLTIAGPTITVSPGALSNGVVGTVYSQTLSAAGGTGPYSFSATGSLPPGLALNAAGTLSGTPTTAGDFTFTAITTDAQSFTGSQAYTVHVAAIAPGAPTIGTATAGTTSASVSFTPPASDGGAPITGYTVTSSPGGFTGSGATSPITVTGLTNGTAYTFTVTATNSAGTGAASAGSNSVIPKGAQTITFSNPGTQNFGTTPTLTAMASSGLTPTFTSSTPSVCTITSGGALTFIAAGTCAVDADQPGSGAWLAAPTVTQNFGVAAIMPGVPTIGTATAGNASATVSFTPPANDGGAPVTGYTVTSSPGGLTSSGAASPITVTGLTNGTTYTFTVTASNSAGPSGTSAPSNSVTSQGAQTITFNNPGATNFGSSSQLVATASSGLAVTFTSTTTTVCTVTSTGILTTRAPGTCTINANQAGNSAWLAAPAVAQSFAIVVPGGTVAFATSSPLPNATGGVAYSQTITAAGGATPYTFSLVSGALPTGMTLSPSGVLAGTSLAAGTFNFTLRVTDAAAQTADKSYQLVVVAPVIALAPASLPGGKVGHAYAQSLTASGGTAPYTYAVTAGALPTGVTLSSAGALSGTPTTAGSFNATVTTTDQHGFLGTQGYTIAVGEPAPVATDDSASVNANGTTTIAVTGNDSGSITSIAITQQPAHGTATVSGLNVVYTPAHDYFGSDTLKYTATGPGGTSAPATVTITVNAPPAPTVAAKQVTTPYNTAASIDLSGSITGVNITAVTIGTAPAHGTVSVSGEMVTYTPSSTYYGGSDSFTYTATNPGGTSAPATVGVTVTPLSVPVAKSLAVITMVGTPVLVQAWVAADGPQPFTGAGVATQPSHGSASASGGQITYVPVAGFVGTDTFGYEVSNNFGHSQPAPVTVTVLAAGSTAGSSATLTTTPGTPVSINLATIVPGSYVSSMLVGMSPVNAGSVSLSQSSTLTFSPASGFRGLVQLSAALVSATGSVVSVNVLVLVSSQPDPSKNPDVLGLVHAQTTQAQRFAQSQLGNIGSRLESLHDGGGTALFSSALSVSLNGRPLQAPRPNASAGPSPGVGQSEQALGGVMRPGIGASESADAAPPRIEAVADGTAAAEATGPQRTRSGLGVWVGGSADFGSFKAYRQAAGFDADAIAISMGVDQRLGEHGLFGFSLGYNHDNSRIANDGTRSIAQGYSAAFYASFQPTAQTYIDAVLGGGGLSFDSRRFDADTGTFLNGSRSGSTWFGSLTAGYQFHLSRWLLSPYGRVEEASSSLSGFSEHGAVTSALTYGRQTVRTSLAAIGLRASGQIPRDWGVLAPSARLEVGHDFQGTSDATLRYAFIPSAGSWNVLANPYSANGTSVQLGLGLGLQLHDGLQLTTDYRYLLMPHAHDQMIRLGLNRQF